MGLETGYEDLRLGIQPFWFWNGGMETEEILRQIEEMHKQEIQGFIIHPRQGMDVPYLSELFMEKVEIAVQAAGERGMEVWLYDEYPYPSGVTAGQVLLDHPEYQCKKLEMRSCTAEGKERVVLDLPWGQVLSAMAYPSKEGKIEWKKGIGLLEYTGISYSQEIFQFSGLTDYNRKRYFTGGQKKQLQWEAPEGSWQIYVFTEVVMTGFKYFGTYVDTLNPNAVRAYLDTTHERYAKRLGRYFKTVIKGIFTDEITAFPPDRPWSTLLPDLIIKRTGIEILSYLPVLFGISMGDMTDRVLYAYWDTCTEAFTESYDKQVSRWCEDHGLLFIGEKPIMRSSSLRYMHCPGVDAGHQKAGVHPLIAPGKYRANAKFAASARHFYGGRAALCEAFHSIGWGMTLQDMKWTFDWLAVQGIQWFVIHAFYYTSNGLKKYDAPPSAFYQMPWWKDMKELSAYAGYITEPNRTLRRIVPLLLVDPVTSLWTAGKGQDEKKKQFGRLQELFLKYRLDYYVIDPGLLAAGEVCRDEEGVGIRINGERFSAVVLPYLDNLEDACFRKVEEFTEAGGITAAVGSLPEKQIQTLDPGPWMKKWLEMGRGNGFYVREGETLCRCLKERLGGYKLEAADGRGMEDVFSAEYGRADGRRVYLLVNAGPAERWISGNIVDGSLRLAPFGSGIFTADGNGMIRGGMGTEERTVELSLDGEWRLALKRPNVLRLGRWSLRAEGTGQKAPDVEPMPVVDQLEKGKMLIPVALKRQFGCPKELELSEDDYEYQTSFSVDDPSVLTEPVYLAMEPEAVRGSFRIWLNDRPLDEMFETKELWLPDNLAVECGKRLQMGENKLRLVVRCKENFDGLRCPLYLAGAFSVRIKGLGWGIGALKKSVPLKDPEAGGIPFYGGVAEYEKDIIMEGAAAGEPFTLAIRDSWLQDSVELWVNGVCLGTRAWSEYGWRIPGTLSTDGPVAVRLVIAGTLLGLNEGQRFCPKSHRYVNYQGEEEEIQAYEAVIYK